MENLKVSVLIANYNGEKYINDCISSLKHQSYNNLEIIFHDDCSSDNSLNEIKKFQNIKIIINQKRGKYGSFNQMAAYQRALNECTGDIIFFLDSDDYYQKNKIEIVMKLFLEQSNLKAVYDLPIYKLDYSLIFKKNKKKLISTYWPYFPPQSCISIKKDIMQKIIKEIKFELFPDIWLDFRIGIYLYYIEKNFLILDKNLTFYRQSKSMISSKFKHLSSSWWQRRFQTHNYIKYFFEKYKIPYKKNLDYFLTSIICNLINEKKNTDYRFK